MVLTDQWISSFNDTCPRDYFLDNKPRWGHSDDIIVVSFLWVEDIVAPKQLPEAVAARGRAWESVFVF